MKIILKGLISNLIRFELWIIGGCTAATFVSDRFLLPAALTIFGLLMIRFFITRNLLRTPVDWGVIGLLVMSGISLIITAIPQKTTPQILRLLVGIGLFYSMVNWGRSLPRLKGLYYLICLISCLLALFGMVNTRWITHKLPLLPESFYQKLPILTSDTIHPGVLSYNLAILLPIIVAIPIFAWRELSRAQRIGTSVAGILTLSVLVITQTRGSLLAFIGGLSLLTILRWKRGIFVILASLVLGLLLVNLLISSNLLNPQVFLTDSSEKLSGRIEIWSHALMMIADFPLSGIGMGLFADLADSLYPFFINAPGSVPHAHNLFLQVAVDLGIPGLISWLAIFLVIIAILWKIYRFNRDSVDAILPQQRWIKGFAGGILASQVVLVVNGISDSVVWGMVKPAPLLWGIWAFAIALWMISPSLYDHE